jgi:PAS domain S-box-containing protein
MSLDSLLHFISSSGASRHEESDLAFAEVDTEGRITSINPFGRLAWGWRTGTELDEDLRFALNGLDSDVPEELPIMAGGLYLRGMRFGDRDGWFLIGYEPEKAPQTGQQVSFRSLMDRIPMPACSLTTNGLAKYVNEAAASVIGQSVQSLTGHPVLAELLHPEDRWKLAEVVELAAGEGSSHATVRFGQDGQSGVLHLVQSVPDEYHAIILPLSGELGTQEAQIVPETFYQSFLEQGPVGIVYLDAQSRVTFENHHFRSIVGTSPSDSWLGFPLSAVQVLDASSARSIVEATENGESWTGTASLRDREEGPVRRYLHIHAAPILHPDGSRIGAALMVEDRTDLEKGRSVLEQYERTEQLKSSLRELSAEHPEPIRFRERATELLANAFSADSATLLGLSMVKDRLVTISHWTASNEQLDPVSVPRAQLAVGERQRFGRFISDQELHGIAPMTGTDVWADPVHDNEQFAGYFVLVWKQGERDMEWATPAKLNEAFRLFENLYSGIQMAARYRTTVAAIDDSLFGFSFLPDGGRRFHFITDQVENLTGYHSSEITGVAEHGIDWMNELIHPEEGPRVRAHHRTLKDGHESRITYRIQHRDGTIRWIREHATPRMDATGMIAVNGILTDVSEQKAAEIVLLQAKKEAESSDRSKTAFIATMSHEIRTPLGAVNGFTQLLEKELDDFEEELPYDLPEQVREFVTAISERSQKLQALVEDLFELSNVEMGKATLQMQTLDVLPLIEKSTQAYRAAAEEKGLNVSLRLPDGPCPVRIDSRRFSQVFDNLISNAVKFTDRGRIDVAVVRSGHDLRLTVEDTGVGIAEDYMDRLFDPFSQEEDWKNRRFEGTGLGLALVKRLVELMGGRIECESRKGFGSAFTVVIPMAADQPVRPPVSDRNSFPESSGDGMAGLNGSSFPFAI